MSILAILAGVIGIYLSARKSRSCWAKEGIPPHLRKHTAGMGIVPSWVSVLNIASWGLVILGVLGLFAKK